MHICKIFKIYLHDNNILVAYKRGLCLLLGRSVDGYLASRLSWTRDQVIGLHIIRLFVYWYLGFWFREFVISVIVFIVAVTAADLYLNVNPMLLGLPIEVCTHAFAVCSAATRDARLGRRGENNATVYFSCSTVFSEGRDSLRRGWGRGVSAEYDPDSYT